MIPKHLGVRRRGVSEVIGTLLLILVLVSAVATYSFFQATAQKQSATRETYLSNVADDSLQIADSQFISDGNGGWASVTLTVRNLDTAGTGLSAISVNGSWMQGWEEVNQQGHALLSLGPSSGATPLNIPGRSSVFIQLSFTPDTAGSTFPYGYHPSASLPFGIVLESSIGDFFSTAYSPPSAVPSATTLTFDLQGLARDSILFDGSASKSFGTSIQAYSWHVEVPKQTSPTGCSTAAFATAGDYDTATVSGVTFQYPSESPSISPASDCIDGPINATLTVTDQNGFLATSSPLIIPADPEIDPVATISAAKSATPCTSPCTVTVSATDAYGNPMAGVVVDAVRVSGDVALNSTNSYPSEATNSMGKASFQVVWTTGGTMSFETGTLLPAQVTFP